MDLQTFLRMSYRRTAGMQDLRHSFLKSESTRSQLQLNFLKTKVNCESKLN